MIQVVFFCQAEDGIRDLVRSRGLGDVYKRQVRGRQQRPERRRGSRTDVVQGSEQRELRDVPSHRCLLYTSDAADERSSVDLGGRRIIKKNTRQEYCDRHR